MKSYEHVTRNYLMRRNPVILRLDGKAFHTFTRGFQKPFDKILMETMWDTTKFLCANIQGCKLAYTQSDEISLLLTDYETIDTCSWFDSNIQKMVSVSASMATLAFNKAFRENVEGYSKQMDNEFLEIYKRKIDTALFDSRVFSIPKEEVCNYFVWRQGDASRNSVQMYGRANSNFSHKELDGKSCDEIQEMLFQKHAINWNNEPTYQKRGTCIMKEKYCLDNDEKTERSRWIEDKDIPIFTKDKSYIEKYL